MPRFRKLEHQAKYLEMSASSWSDELRKIERLCNKMQEKGWSLLTMSWPNKENAVLVFTRPAPRKPEEDET